MPSFDNPLSDGSEGDYALVSTRHLGHVSLLRKTVLDTNVLAAHDGVDTDIAPARPEPPARYAPSAPSARENTFENPLRPAHISAVVRDRG